MRAQEPGGAVPEVQLGFGSCRRPCFCLIEQGGKSGWWVSLKTDARSSELLRVRRWRSAELALDARRAEDRDLGWVWIVGEVEPDSDPSRSSRVGHSAAFIAAHRSPIVTRVARVSIQKGRSEEPDPAGSPLLQGESRMLAKGPSGPSGKVSDAGGTLSAEKIPGQVVGQTHPPGALGTIPGSEPGHCADLRPIAGQRADPIAPPGWTTRGYPTRFLYGPRFIGTACSASVKSAITSESFQT